MTADPHVELARRYRAGCKRLETPGLVPDDGPLGDEIMSLQRQILGKPANTLRGVREQVWLVLSIHDSGCVLSDANAAGLRRAVATLDRLERGGGVRVDPIIKLAGVYRVTPFATSRLPAERLQTS